MAIVAVCRLAILKRMLATPLTLLVAHRVREQVKVQVQRSGMMKTWGGSRTQRVNILNSQMNQEYNDIDWVGLYNSDKLSSLRVDELSLYFSHHKITFKGKKAEKVAMIKAHIGSLLHD